MVDMGGFLFFDLWTWGLVLRLILDPGQAAKTPAIAAAPVALRVNLALKAFVDVEDIRQTGLGGRFGGQSGGWA